MPQGDNRWSCYGDPIRELRYHHPEVGSEGIETMWAQCIVIIEGDGALVLTLLNKVLIDSYCHALAVDSLTSQST